MSFNVKRFTCITVNFYLTFKPLFHYSVSSLDCIRIHICVSVRKIPTPIRFWLELQFNIFLLFYLGFYMNTNIQIQILKRTNGKVALKIRIFFQNKNRRLTSSSHRGPPPVKENTESENTVTDTSQ